MGLYYVVLNIRDEIEKLDVEIEDLRRELTTRKMLSWEKIAEKTAEEESG
jgi:hypothetical protein